MPLPAHPNAPPASAHPAGEPPIEAERSLLAAMLLSPEALEQGLRELPPEAFYRAGHRAIFQGLSALAARGDAPSLISLAAWMEGEGTLELAGGRNALIELLHHYGTTTANLAQHARLVRAHHLRRRTRAGWAALGERMDDPTEALPELLERAQGLLEEARREAAPAPLAPSLLEQVITGEELLTRTLAPLESLVGERLLTAGGLSLVVGMAGLGKTYLALQLLRSLATGTPWLGHAAAQGRCGLLELEMPLQMIQHRLAAGLPSPSAAREIDFLVMPEGIGYVYEPRTVDELSRWAERSRLRLLVMDPLRDTHDGDENLAFDVVRLYSALKLVRQRTGCAIMLLHHVNKMEWDKTMSLRTSVLRSVRGSGRFVDEPETVLGLVERVGHSLLVYAKTRNAGGLGESIGVRQHALGRPQEGYFERCDTPAEVADRNVEKVRHALEYYGAAGASINQLAEMCELDRGTVKRHLATLGVSTVKAGREVRAYADMPAKVAEELPF